MRVLVLVPELHRDAVEIRLRVGFGGASGGVGGLAAGDADGEEFLAEGVVLFALPFLREEGLDLGGAADEMVAVAPWGDDE